MSIPLILSKGCMIPMCHFKAAESVELDVVRKWVKNNFVTFEDTSGLMFEKYDVRRVGPGSGGEYDVQTGFGWTNGVAISLLARYVSSTNIQY